MLNNYILGVPTLNSEAAIIIVTDMLTNVFGFDKYLEITSEYVIRCTFVDLAIKFDGKIQTLIEVKAVGLDLKEIHVRQAIDYAVKQGVDWVILTNGTNWQIYKVYFNKPIDQELILEFDFLNLNPRNPDDIEHLYFLTKEGWSKTLLGEYYTQRQVLNRYSIGAILLSDPILKIIRHELRCISPDVKIETEQIQEVLLQEILKRDVVEGEKAENAKKKITRAFSKISRKVSKETTEEKLEVDEQK
jgi:hypothetical protein